MAVPNATPGSGTRNWTLAGSLIADAAAEGREAWPAHLRLGARLLGRGGAEAALLRGWAAPALDATAARPARRRGRSRRAGDVGHSCRCPRFDAGGSHEPAALLAAALALYGACGLDGEPLRARFAAAAAAAGRGGAGRGRRGGWRRRRRGGSWSGAGYRATTWTRGARAGASLSAGAFGEVWRAHWRARPVAVKVVRLREARAVRAFLKEASLLRSVEHPNVVQCHGYSVGPGPRRCPRALRVPRDGPQPPRRPPGYRIPPPPLPRTPRDPPPAGYLARHPGLRVGERAGLARDVAAALAHLHSRPRPVIHCDLKPSNVLVSGDGRAQVCDFGLAKARIASLSGAARPASSASSSSGPSQGSLFGTLHYTAPEVFAFDSGREGSPAALLTPALDMYSFSMLLFEISTGTEPWRDLLRFVPVV
eukprot:tig00021127_g18850.t1